ncbi:type II secretion system F family protein [Thermopolyspora sp. NPDC052614]|uniref:type II secretion system F family protein n=1 Tax=Thermopolyspora sp. NPDC052614 TaxID=3155682 RepID=UPI0034124CCC
MVAILVAGLAAWVGCGPGPRRLRLRELALRSVAERRWRTWASGFVLRLGRLARPGRADRKAAAWRRACVELCQAIVAELAAGRASGEALVQAIAAVDPPDPVVLRPVAAVARDGGDIPSALAEAAHLPGAEGLRRLAMCWQVSVTVGAGLAGLVEGVATSLREAEAHRRDLAAQLAGPRATARLLAGLPVLGILMAVALGMRPFDFLLGHLGGIVCLVVGLSLDAAGIVWINRMVAAAERSASL